MGDHAGLLLTGLGLLAAGLVLALNLWGVTDRLTAHDAELRARQAERSRWARFFIQEDEDEDREALRLTYTIMGGGALVIGIFLAGLALFG